MGRLNCTEVIGRYGKGSIGYTEVCTRDLEGGRTAARPPKTAQDRPRPPKTTRTGRRAFF
jgi:hypothetical protein